ncbi:fungal-specific transcription factor domain-containing protein [Chlamydoabsidia padenii]|nr:fungal-specific transcription factor domain-containing protein [Chlamydoabsidia padenii]
MNDDPAVSNYQKWISCYFGYFNVFFPVLAQAHFMRDFSQQQVDPLLCYAVCALGSKYSDGDQDVSRFFFERCQCILNAPRAPINLSTVQALVILCWYSYLLGNMQTCCELRQLLNQAVHDLQLHRDPGSSFGIVAIEMRRRAFWVAFVIDQWLSCCTDKRFLVLQDGWNCQWPRLEDSQLLVIDSKQWKPTTHNNNNDEMVHHQQSIIDSSCYMPDLSTEYALQITAFSEMIKLACIVGDMHDLHAPLVTSLSLQQQSIVSRLTDWLLRLPPYLEYGKPTDNSPPSPIARIYHMLYYTVQIMIHQPLLDHHHHQQQYSAITSSLTSPPSSPPTSINGNANHTSAINMSRAICTNAANTIIHIAEQMIQYKQQMYLHNTFMVSLTLASSVQLDNTLNSEQTYGISSLLNLDKSFQVLKNCNCSVLESMEFGQLLDRYLVDHYGIQFQDKNLERHQQQSQQQQQGAHRRLSCLKRTMGGDCGDVSDTEIDSVMDTSRKRRNQRKKSNAPIGPLTMDLPLIGTSSTSSPQAPITPEHWNMDTLLNNSHYSNNDKDDLLDTRLHSLLHDSSITTNENMVSPLSISNNITPTVLDPIWLDETTSILDLFTDPSTIITTATSSPSTSHYQSYSSPSSSSPGAVSGHRCTPIDSWQSPASFVSPTQSPTLSSDSNILTVVTPMTTMSYCSGDDCDTDYFKSTGALFYPPNINDSIKLYDFISDSTFIPSYTH